MSKYLPTHGFRWLTASEVANFDIRLYEDEQEDGFILEVDLKYPHHLHDQHSDYPLAAEQLEITSDMLSEH